MSPTRLAAVVLTGVLLLAGCGGGSQPGSEATVTTSAGAGSPTTGSPATSSPATSSPATSSPATTTAGATPPAGADAAVETVRAWLTALGNGDLEAARADLGLWSQRNAEGQGGLEGMASGLAEGMAAFAAEGVQWTVVAVPEHPRALVVVASGEVEREGMREQAAHAWLVHPQRGEPVVEAFSPAPPEVMAPQPGEPLGADAPVEVLLPAGTALAVADGELVTSGVTSEPADGDRVRVRVLPDGGWSPGRHVVAVVTVPQQPGGDAPWGTVAVTFETA
jgi:hypothetical protein